MNAAARATRSACKLGCEAAAALVFNTHLLVSHGISRREECREHLHAFQQGLIEVLEEVSIGQAPVPVLHNVTTIHDLSKDVSQVIPRHLQARQTCEQADPAEIWLCMPCNGP